MKDQRGEIASIVLVAVAIIAVVTIVIPPLVSITGGITTSQALQWLEGEGYYVIANGQCASTNIDPCTADTYSIGADGNEWQAIYANEHHIDGRAKIIWNQSKQRAEYWWESFLGDQEWLLYDAFPASRWEDNFQTSLVLLPSLIGLQTNFTWAVNGLNSGGDVDEANYITANAIGGGLDVTVPSAGWSLNDYAALHWGDSYPIAVSQDFQAFLELVGSTSQSGNYNAIIGFADDTTSRTNTAFVLPDNAIYYWIGSDNNLYTKTRDNGVETNSDLIAPISGSRTFGRIYIDVDQDSITLGDLAFSVNGSRVATYDTGIPTEQLQPYMAVVSTATPSGNIEVGTYNFLLLQDFFPG